MIKACIFDLDGTLVNSLYDLMNSTNYALEKCGFEAHPIEAYKYFIGGGAVKLISRALPKEDRDDETINKVLSVYSQHYKEHCLDMAKAYDGVIPMLKKLKDKGYKICVVSNKPDNFTQDFMNKLFSEVDFDMAIGKREEFAVKPNPESLNYVVGEIGLKNEECIYIGDSDVDVITAHNANMKCIGVSWGFRGRKELEAAGSDYIIDNAEEIFDILGE